MSAFRVGQKVVCIDNAHGSGFLPVLQLKAIYTVEAVKVDDGRGTIGTYAGEHVSLVLREIANPYDWLNGAFAAARFRPAVDQSDDVALFTHHFDREGVSA